MTDLPGKTWVAVGETDDPNAIIETCEVEAATQNCIGLVVRSAIAKLTDIFQILTSSTV